MTRKTYTRLTSLTRSVLSRLPGGERLLRAPTVLCAAAYLMLSARLLLRRDPRLLRVLLVPASCFAAATLLRRMINRARPYDRFSLPPVGRFTPGKGRSLPSRHTASAAAIALAFCYVYPHTALSSAMVLLALLIAALRVLSGHHDEWDVLSALALSWALSFLGYSVFSSPILPI
ncbi:MAG: phosphatase PAP2 family protein [Clostridia bacterium]|nr:phosphatase PAP2 family protein [Clostridia bacterium]